MVSCKSAASAEREWRRKFSIYRLELCAVYCIRHMRYKTRQHQANIMVAFDDDELAWAATAAALRSSVCVSRLRPPRRVTLAMAGHRLWPAFHLIYCYERRVWQTRGSQQSTKKKNTSNKCTSMLLLHNLKSCCSCYRHCCPFFVRRYYHLLLFIIELPWCVCVYVGSEPHRFAHHRCRCRRCCCCSLNAISMANISLLFYGANECNRRAL